MKLYALTNGIYIEAVKAMSLQEVDVANSNLSSAQYYKGWKLLSESEYVGVIKEMK